MMMPRRLMDGVAHATAVVAAVCASSAWADGFDVPGDFATFDEAVAAASDGDTIRLLAPGLLLGDAFIDLGGKALTIERVSGQLRISDNTLLSLPDGSAIVAAPSGGFEAPGTTRIEGNASVTLFAQRLDQIGDLIVGTGGRLDAFLGTNADVQDLLRLDADATLDVVVAENGSVFQVDGVLDLRPGSRFTLDPKAALRVSGDLRARGATLVASELEASELGTDGQVEFIDSTVRLDRLSLFGEATPRFVRSDTRIESDLSANVRLEVIGGTFFAHTNDGFGDATFLDADVTLSGPVFGSSGTRIERSRFEVLDGNTLDLRGATIEDAELVADDVRAGALQEPGPVAFRRTSVIAFDLDFDSDAVGSGEWFAEVRNHAALIIDDTTSVFGRFDNAGTLVVRGDVTVFGAFANDGTLIGEVGTVGAFEIGAFSPRISVLGGPLTVGRRGALALPQGAVVEVSGGVRVLNDEPEAVVLDGVGVRVLASSPGGAPSVVQLGGDDALALPGAFDGSIPGTLALAELVYAPGAEDELIAIAPLEPGETGAIYVDRLVVEAGAVLENPGVVVYARSAEIAGELRTPENVVVVAQPCVADLDASGTPDVFDVIAYLGLLDRGSPGADLDASGVLDVIDVIAILGAFDAGC